MAHHHSHLSELGDVCQLFFSPLAPIHFGWPRNGFSGEQPQPIFQAGAKTKTGRKFSCNSARLTLNFARATRDRPVSQAKQGFVGPLLHSNQLNRHSRINQSNAFGMAQWRGKTTIPPKTSKHHEGCRVLLYAPAELV